MVSIPEAPNGPTVYVVGDKDADAAFGPLIDIAKKTFKTGPCEIESVPATGEITDAERSAFLEFLQDEYNAHGAFIVGLASRFLDEASDAYDEIDDACLLLGEVGVVVRRPGELRATAPRLRAATATLDRLLPKDTPEVLILGAGLDARAVAAALSTGACDARPAKMTIASTDAKGLADVRQRIETRVEQGSLEVRHVAGPAEHDRLLALMPPRSAVIGASIGEYGTGMVSAGAALFPTGSIVCDLLSPAGKSRILAEAVQQRGAAELVIHDSRVYTIERRIAILEAMFGADATGAQRGALRKALEKYAD